MTRRWITPAALTLLCVTSLHAQETAKKPAATADLKKDASYCIGVSIGRNFKDQALDLDSEQLMQGLKDALGGAKVRFSDEQVQEILTAFQTRVAAEEAAKRKMLAEKNKTEGAEFLAANGKKAGIKTTPSGLQYEVLKAADGPAPKATDSVKVHYKGTLLDGTQFDSSYDRGEPITFALDGVIKGWTEGLQLMNVGSKYRLYVPAELAYGANPRPGGPIGPNAVLVFEVELLGIEKQ